MNPELSFDFETRSAAGAPVVVRRAVAPASYVIAGWTGRDPEAIRHHVVELQAIGVPPPSTMPIFYRAGANLLTQSGTIEVVGGDSSGEVEPVLFFAAGEWWLTVGSDHTDRKVEAYSIAVSKQMCPKPIATTAWRWADVAGHQDELELCSRILEDGAWVDYQRGTFAAIRPLADVRDTYFGTAPVAPGTFMTCGTLGTVPNAAGVGLRTAPQMELELHDPRLGRRIAHRYAIAVLPVVA